MNTYETTVNEAFAAHIALGGDTGRLAARMARTAIRYEFAARHGYSMVAARELASYEDAVARLGCDPLDR